MGQMNLKEKHFVLVDWWFCQSGQDSAESVMLLKRCNYLEASINKSNLSFDGNKYLFNVKSGHILSILIKSSFYLLNCSTIEISHPQKLNMHQQNC